MKRILLFLASALLSAGALQSASAGMLDDAFSNTIAGASASLTDSGTFKSQLRTTQQLGRFSMRFRTAMDARVVQLFNIQPPNLEVGCNGIDFTLGGFSYVNSAVIEQMIKSIIQGAAMYVIQLALNAICEDCVAELRSVIDKINKATQMLQDDCHAGAALAAWALGGDANQGTQSTQTRCERQESEDGDFASQIEARMSDICQGADKVTSWLHDQIYGKSGTDPSQQSVAMNLNTNAAQAANTTWQALKAAGIVTELRDSSTNESAGFKTPDARANQSFMMGELLMSMMGTTIPDKSNGAQVAATIDAQTALEIMMCGTAFFGSAPTTTDTVSDDSATTDPTKMVQRYCAAIFSTQTASGGVQTTVHNMLMCSDTGGLSKATDRFGDCLNLELQENASLQTWMGKDYVQSGLGQGYLFHVLTLEQSILQKITSGSGGYSQDEIGLMEAAPFPLYKALNLAAVFPEVAGDMMKLTGIPMAYMMAAQFFQKSIQQSVQKHDPVTLPKDFMYQLRDQLRLAEQMSSKRVDEMFEEMHRIEAINAEIDNINKIMLLSVHQRNLMGNAAIAADVTDKYALLK